MLGGVLGGGRCTGLPTHPPAGRPAKAPTPAPAVPRAAGTFEERSIALGWVQEQLGQLLGQVQHRHGGAAVAVGEVTSCRCAEERLAGQIGEQSMGHPPLDEPPAFWGASLRLRPPNFVCLLCA